MIKCIFLSEFDNAQGPIISFQVPDNYISKEIFEAIQNFIITKSDLQGRLITVTAFGHKFMGCPVYIDNDKYKRNALIFNVCFAFDEDSNPVHYGPVVRKLAACMTQLENESSFLSNPETRENIPLFLGKVMESLNSCGSCHINDVGSCGVDLKLLYTAPEPIAIENHHVPILNVPKEVVLKHQLDLTTHQIIHYVDGISHIFKIAAEADVELELVKACLQNWVYYKLVQIVPIFQYSNLYTVTVDINKLIEDSHLQQECLKYVAKSERHLPALRDVFTLYSAFTPGTTVKDICTRPTNPHGLHIDERKLVQFGVMKGLLRRIHKYPIVVEGETLSPRVVSFCHLLDGTHNFDQICCETGLNHNELEDRLEVEEGVIILKK